MKLALCLAGLLAASALGAVVGVGCSSSSTPTNTGDDGGGGGPDSASDSAGPSDGGTTDAADGPSSCPLSPYDAATVADSSCGNPGDQGNSLGVGAFCVNPNTDCSCHSKAVFCSTIGGPGAYFCTFPCTAPPDGGAADAANPCGENAACQCQGGSCGCTPNSCL
jgi:hypothetical protein